MAELLALVAGQDVAEGDDGVFRIVRGVARDRVISTVDPEARHGHKSKHRRFDGYKAHVSIDPDSELIDEVVATPANTPDRDAVDRLGQQGYEVVAKVPPVRNSTGGFSKDRFVIDLEAGTVTCTAQVTVTVHPKEAILAEARTEQATSEWSERYRADRPVVKRKIAHLVRRLWGGRKARCRERERVTTDLDTRAGAVNWARLAALGLTFRDGGWAFDSG